MQISSNIHLKEAYLSHTFTIQHLKLKQKQPMASDKLIELKNRIEVLQEMADAADRELQMNLKNQEA